MVAAAAVAVALAVIVAVRMIVRLRSPHPEFAPLPTDADDPLLIAAMAQARATRHEFVDRLRAPKQGALVKLRFVSNSNQVEHLWAEVHQLVGDDELDVVLVTPPVTHHGHLDRRYRCRLDEIEDWQVRDSEGRVHGGFTQRAMFAIARRDGVVLPPELRAQEDEYR